MPSLPISQPITLGAVSLRNRNIMASLTRNRSVPTNVPNDINLEYYAQRAPSCGLIITEGTLISHQGVEWPNAPGIWTEEQTVAWKKITDEIHRLGSKTFCQIWHVGRIANNDMEEQKLAGQPVPGPSALLSRVGKYRTLPGVPGHSVPEAIDDPSKIIADYLNAAENAKKAGFDGVELHAANGYLVHQFLDTTSNVRTDAYGGSVENRCRFGLEALDALISVYGADKVGIKINPAGGYNDVGMPMEETLETFNHFINEVLARKIAYIQLVRYLDVMDPTINGEKRGTIHDILATYGPLIKKSPSTKLLYNGNLHVDEANDLISKDLIDAGVFGVPWIANPDFQLRVEKGLPINDHAISKWFYVYPNNDLHVGYTDYPTAEESGLI